MRNERGVSTIDSMGIKRIIHEYYEQRYGHNLDKTDELPQFLERQNYQNLNKEKSII